MKFEEKIVVLKNGKNAILRAGQITDAKMLTESFEKIKTQTRFISLGAEDKGMTIEEQEERISRYLDSKTEWLIVAVVDGRIVGSCTFGTSSTKNRTRHRASLGIALEEEYTNNGLGTELLKCAINTCTDYGFERLELGCIVGNDRALKVYTRLGFKETGRIPYCFKYSDGTYGDERLMSMSLIN